MQTHNHGEPDVVVEIRGGTVVAVYTRSDSLRVALVDWDEVTCGEPTGSTYLATSLHQIPFETRDLIVSASAVERR